MREARYHNLASHLSVITCALNAHPELRNISSIEMDAVDGMRDYVTDVHLAAPATFAHVAEWGIALGITGGDVGLIEEHGDRIAVAGDGIRVFARKTADSPANMDADADVVDTLWRVVCASMANGPYLQDVERIDFENPQRPEIWLRGPAAAFNVEVWAKALGIATREPYGIVIAGQR